MTITELATIVDEELQIRWHSNLGDWIAHFEHGETKEDYSSSILTSEYGRGWTPEKALAEYVEVLKGKILIFHAAYPARRKEFKVPITLRM